jgi:hypothetical protein
MKLRLGLALLAVSLVAAGCGDDDDVTDAGLDSALVQEAVDALVDSGMSRDMAECFAGTLIDEFGVAEFVKVGSGEEPSPELTARSVELFAECAEETGDVGSGFGFESGEMPSDFREMARPRSEVDGPYTYGDDAELDGLWDDCEAGSGTACDSLFFRSPIGSEYEAFGNTCGNRMELEFDCTSLGE